MAALRYISGSVTQGGADAFAIASIATALAGATRQAYRIRELEFEIPRPMVNVINSNVEVTLSRRTKTAMPVITDVDVLKKIKVCAEFTTSGAQNAESVFRFAYAEDEDLLVVEDPLYLMVDSLSTTLTQTVYCRIGYEVTTISEVDRLTLLTQSLL